MANGDNQRGGAGLRRRRSQPPETTATGLTRRPQQQRSGLRRGTQDDPALGPYEQALQMGGAQLRSAVPSALGTVAGSLGYEEYAQEQAEEAAAIQERAAERAPDVMQASDVEGVEDVPQYVGQTLLAQGPNLLATGVGAIAGGGAANLARRGLRRVASSSAAREGAEEAGEQAARRAQSLDRTTRAGAVAGGGTAGGALVSSEAFPQYVLDEEGEGSIQERSLKALSVSMGGGALEALGPVAGGIRRAGLSGAARDLERSARRSSASRVARAAGGQAATEAATEGAQQSLIRGVHGTINENIEAFDDEGIQELMNAMAAGGIVGGATGGAAGGFAAVRGGRNRRRRLQSARSRRRRRQQARGERDSAAARRRFNDLSQRRPDMAERFQAMAGEDGSGLDDPQVQRELADLDLNFSRELDPRPDMEFGANLQEAASTVLGELSSELSDIQSREGLFTTPEGYPRDDSDRMTTMERARNTRESFRDIEEESNRLSQVYDRLSRAYDRGDTQEFVTETFRALNRGDVPITPENFDTLRRGLEPYGEQFSDMWRRVQREEGGPGASIDVDMTDSFDDDSGFSARSEFDDLDTFEAEETEGIDRSFENSMSEIDLSDTERNRVTYVGKAGTEGEVRPWLRSETSQLVENQLAQEEGRQAQLYDNLDKPRGARDFIQRRQQRYGRVDDPPDTAITPEGMYQRVPYSEVVRAEFISRQRSDTDPGDPGTDLDSATDRDRLQGAGETEREISETEVDPQTEQQWRNYVDRESDQALEQRQQRETPAEPSNTVDERLDDERVRDTLRSIPEESDYIGRGASDQTVQQAVKGTRYAGAAGRERLRDVIERAATGTGRELTEQQRNVVSRLTDVAEQRVGSDRDVERYLDRRGREMYEADLAEGGNAAERANRTFNSQDPSRYLDNFEAVRRTEMPPQLGGGDPTALTDADVRAADMGVHEQGREYPRGAIPFTEQWVNERGQVVGERTRLFNSMELAKQLTDRNTPDVGRGSDGGTVQRAADLVWEAISSLLNRPAPETWQPPRGVNSNNASPKLRLDTNQVPGDTVAYTFGRRDDRFEVTWDAIMAEGGAERLRRQADTLKSAVQETERAVQEAGTNRERNRMLNRLNTLNDQLTATQSQLEQARRDENKREKRIDSLAVGIVSDSPRLSPGDVIEAKKYFLGNDAWDVINGERTVTPGITSELRQAAELHHDARIRQRAESMAGESFTEEESTFPRMSQLSRRISELGRQINEYNSMIEDMDEAVDLGEETQDVVEQADTLRRERNRLRTERERLQQEQRAEQTASADVPITDQSEQPVDVADPAQHRKPGVAAGDNPAGVDQDTRPQRRRGRGEYRDRRYSEASPFVFQLGNAERATRRLENARSRNQAVEIFNEHFDDQLTDQVQSADEVRAIAERRRQRFASQLWAIDESTRIADMESALRTHSVESAQRRYRQLFGKELPRRTTMGQIEDLVRQRREGKTPEQPRTQSADEGSSPRDTRDTQDIELTQEQKDRLIEQEESGDRAARDANQARTDAFERERREIEAREIANETALANEWARKAGLNNTIEVIPYEDAILYLDTDQIVSAASGQVNGFAISLNDQTLIYLNRSHDPQVRVETLAHELGHIVFKEHAEALTNEQASEVLAAFNRWRAEYNKDAVEVDDVWNSKRAVASMHDAANGRQVGELSQKERDYLFDYEEWFADNVSRWLTQTQQPKTVVERFFKSIAESLERLFNAASRRYRAHPSVAGFMRELWGLKKPDQAYVTADATEARDQAYEDMPPPDDAMEEIKQEIEDDIRADWGQSDTATDDAADAAVHHESDPHSAGATASFRRVYDQILTPEERRALAQVFTQPQVRRKLDAFLDYGTMALIDSGDTKSAVIFGYHHWLNGDLQSEDLSPRAHSLFQKFGRTLSDTFGIITRHEQGMEVMEALENGAIAGRQQAESHVGDGVVRRYLRRNKLEEVGYRAMNAYEQTMKAFRFVMPAQSALYMSDIPALQAFTNEFNPRVGEQRVGQTMFEARQQMRSRFHNAFNNATRPLTEEQGREALEVLQGAQDLPAEGTPVRQAVDEVRRTLREMRAYGVARGVDMGYIEDYFPWVFDTDTLATRRAEFVNLLAQDKYAEDLAELFGEDAPASVEAREHLANRVYDVLINHDGYGDTDMQVQDGNNTPALSAAHQRRLNFLYEKGNADDRRQLASFFSKDIGGTLAPYVEQIVKRAEWTSRFGSQGEGINTRLEQARAEGATEADIERAKKYLNAMMGTHGRELAPPLRKLITVSGEFFGEDWSSVEPDKIRSVQGAIMVYQNIRTLGLATLTSVADTGGIMARSGDLDTAFAAFRAGMKEIALGIRSMVRDQNESEDTYRSELRKLAESMGTVDMHMVNEVLGESYGGLYLHGRARQWNEKWFRWIQLQRWTRFSRTMALASAKTFLVRHRGGLYNEHSQRFMEQLNLRDDDVITDDEGDLVVYSDGDRTQMIGERRAQLERDAAEREAGNHQAADEALAEANRIRDDLNRDMRIRTALNRFVDESVMRPNAAHRPIWASHPDAMLIFHLKQFAYSIHNQIVRRILSEAGQGNYRPAAFAMSYIPIMMASDLLREMVQFGPDGDPRKEHWDSWDRVKDAVHRSGMTGMGTFLMDAHKDRTQFGGVGLESLQGPTVAQSLDIADTLSGDRPASDTLADALPGQALYGNWGFDATQAEERPVGEMANMGSGRYYYER